MTDANGDEEDSGGLVDRVKSAGGEALWTAVDAVLDAL